MYWIAAWTDEHGATRQRKFSVARYGEEEAKRLAIAEREYQLKRVCAINVAGRELQPLDKEGIWEATLAEGGLLDYSDQKVPKKDPRLSPEELKRVGNERVTKERTRGGCRSDR